MNAALKLNKIFQKKEITTKIKSRLFYTLRITHIFIQLRTMELGRELYNRKFRRKIIRSQY